MEIERTEISGPVVVTPARHSDARGWFMESWSRSKLHEQGFSRDFVQDNLSFSKAAGTLRGLHFQRPPEPQGKLVQVIAGAVLDVAVDVRSGSPTFGEHVALSLDADSPRQLFVPEGFLHGFVTLEPDTLVAYKVTAPYSREHDAAVAWDDPDLGIDWGVETPVLSDKDARAPRLRDIEPPFPEGWDKQA